MLKSLIPSYVFKKYTDITPRFLLEIGVDFLMLDLDNTLAKYSEHEPSPDCIEWVTTMNENGITLYLVSNSKRETRVDSFAAALNLPFVKNARKPSPSRLFEAMALFEKDKHTSAFLGDQIFTDTHAANRASVCSILVRPLSLKNPLLFLRYIAEIPFRLIYALMNYKER